MDSIIQTFHLDWRLILAQVINFVIVVGVLWFFAMKPLAEKMAERTKKIEQGLADAKTMAENVKLSEREKSDVLKQARAEAQQIVQAAQAAAQTAQQEATAVAKQQVQKIMDDGQRQLTAEKDAMVQAVKEQAGELVMLATANLLKNVVDKDIDKALVKKALAEAQGKKV